MRNKFRNNWKITRKYFENKSELIRKTMNYFGNKTSEIIRKQFKNNWEQPVASKALALSWETGADRTAPAISWLRETKVQ